MKARLAIAAAAAVLSVFLAQGLGTPAPALAAPANDNLANAVAIGTPDRSGIVVTGSNVGATTEGGENTAPCSGTGKTIWYTWTSPATPGTVVFDTFGGTVGAENDTVLAIYTGSGYPLTLAGCNDDVWGTNRPSSLTLSYAASTTYRIQVGGFNGAYEGDVVLSMALGGAMYLNSTLDGNVRDSFLTLREAMLVATGGLAFGTLTVTEQSFIRNGAGAGASGSDLIRFPPAMFPPSAPAQIDIGASLPTLSTGYDVVSGIGAGVIVDGTTAGNVCLYFDSDNNHAEGLWLRDCTYAAVLVEGTGNIVGGALAIQRNTIVTSSSGVFVGDPYTAPSAFGTVIQGNYIGTDGTADLGMTGSWPGGGVGVMVAGALSTTIGGTLPGAGNVISGSQVGVVVSNSSTTFIYGNKIGTDATGTAAIPNGAGVWVGTVPATVLFYATDTHVGEAFPGYGNIIAFNTTEGVDAIESNAKIEGNSIHSNGGVGILNVYANESPAPIVASVAGGTVSGFTCPFCRVDLYNDLAEEGRVWLGFDAADGAGNFSLSGLGHAMPKITATTRNLSNFTSEFSEPFAAAPNQDGDSLPDSEDGCTFDPEDVDGWEDGDGCPDTDNDGDGICDAGQTSVSCTGSDVGRYEWTEPPGAPVDCRNVTEDFDAFHDSDGCPEPDNDLDSFSDATDDCPAADSNAGPDGIPDSGDEPVLYLTPYQAKEDFDGVLDNDGCHDSPGDDYDRDGFSDEAEALTIGTNAAYPCGGESWPADLWDLPPFSANKITVQDITSFIAPVRRLGTSAGDPNFSPRWDLAPGKGVFLTTINVQDLSILVTLYPPMLNGARALNGPVCPLPSQ